MGVFNEVYKILKKIPRGNVTTYGAIAKKLGTTPRVVGFALNKNPNPITVPCHRVVGIDGHLVGYRRGLDKKRKLLRSEGAEFRNKTHIDLEKSLWKDAGLG